jgi:hypothetical protein
LASTGWSVTKIIAQVMARTENRAANKAGLDWYMEFWQALDEFCQEKHFWWRRRVASFATVVGQQDYDLSDENGANAPDCEEIEEMYAINVQPCSHNQHVNPMFTARAILASIYGAQAVSSNPIPRDGYFLIPGEFQQLYFSQPPQAAITVGFTYWAVPMVVSADVGGDVVPLVPPYLHWGLTYMLERRVYEYLYGQNDPRFVTSNARYQQFITSAARSKQFSSQQAIESRMQGPSVVASGGRGRWGTLHGNR